MKEYPKIETLLDRDERFKVIPGKWRLPEFDYLKDNQWIWTEKIDGTNVRVMWDGAAVSFGGRTDNAQMPPFLVRRLAELFPSGVMSAAFLEPAPVCLYGEGYGAKIQKGGGNYKSDGVDFILFDVKVGDWWLKREDVEDVARKLNIKVVPVVGQGTLESAICCVREGSNKSTFGNFQAEGLVLRPAVDLCTRSGHRLIAKIKARDF